MLARKMFEKVAGKCHVNRVVSQKVHVLGRSEVEGGVPPDQALGVWIFVDGNDLPGADVAAEFAQSRGNVEDSIGGAHVTLKEFGTEYTPDYVLPRQLRRGKTIALKGLEHLPPALIPGNAPSQRHWYPDPTNKTLRNIR